MNSVASLLFLVVFIFVEKSACKYARSHRSHREIHHDATVHDRHVRGQLAEGERHRHANHEFGHRQGHFRRRLDDFISHPNTIDTDAIGEKYANDAIGKNKGGRKTIDADVKPFEGAAATFAERVVKKQESPPQVEGEAAKGRDRAQFDASGNRLTVCAFDYAVLHALDKAAQRVLNATAASLELLVFDAFEEIRKATLNLEPTKVSQLTSITECAYVAENMNRCFRIPNNVSNSYNFTECSHVNDKFNKCLKNLQTEKPSLERMESSVARSMSIAPGTVRNASPKPTEPPETLPGRSSDTLTRNAIRPLNVSAESTTLVAPSTSTTFGVVENPSTQSAGMPASTNTSEANGSTYFSEAEQFQEHLRTVDLFDPRKPTPELIPVGKIYGNVLPNCTVLHRCRRDCVTCCPDETEEYVPASEKTVGLYFQIKGKNDKKESPTYQLLRFTNHTSCKCQKKVLSNEIVQDTKPIKDLARTMSAAGNADAYSSSSKDVQDERPSSPR